MSSPSTILHGRSSKRLTGLRAGAARLAFVYLVFATAWIATLHTLLPRLVDQTRARSLEPIEDGAFAICTGLVIYWLVKRFNRERAIVEQALRRNERRYRSLVLATAQVTWTSAANGEVVDPLPTWEAFSGQQFSQYRGLGWQEAIHPQDRAAISERWRKAVNRESRPPNNRYFEIEYRVRRHDGIYRHFVNRTVPVLNNQGEVEEWVGVSFDITEQKAAEQELRASEHRFQLVTRATTDLVYDWDMATDAIWWNENLHLMFGYRGQPEELGLKFWSGLLHPEDATRVRTSMFGAIAAGKEFWADEYRLRRSDGSYANILERGYILPDAAGRPARMIGAMMDITDRKLAEQRLRDSREQLRALSAHLEQVREEERTRIAREIHDELGQALTGLKLDLSWFAGRLPNQPLLAEKSAAMLKLIDSTVNAVRRLSTELRPAVLDNLGLSAAIEWLAQEFQRRTGVSCEFITPEDDLVLDKDRTTALFRIAQEALTNVARHARARSVHILLERDGTQLLLRITDDGRGIADLEQHSTHSFGLLGMRERAHLLGGTFEIAGRAGEGTTLTVQLPADEAALEPKL